jgi:hypothetical protein
MMRKIGPTNTALQDQQLDADVPPEGGHRPGSRRVATRIGCQISANLAYLSYLRNPQSAPTHRIALTHIGAPRILSLAEE